MVNKINLTKYCIGRINTLQYMLDTQPLSIEDREKVKAKMTELALKTLQLISEVNSILSDIIYLTGVPNQVPDLQK